MMLDSTTHIILKLLHFILQFPYICAISAPPGFNSLISRLSAGMDVLERAQYLVSDFIVVWRACAIWPHNTAVRVGLGFCLLVTTGEHLFYSLGFMCIRLADD